MNPLYAFILGIACGAIPTLLAWARSADAVAIEAAKSEDAAYRRGYNRALWGQPQERSKAIVHTTL